MHYDRTGLNKAIDVAKSNNSKEFMVCHYIFLIMDSNFKALDVMVAMI